MLGRSVGVVHGTDSRSGGARSPNDGACLTYLACAKAGGMQPEVSNVITNRLDSVVAHANDRTVKAQGHWRTLQTCLLTCNLSIISASIRTND